MAEIYKDGSILYNFIDNDGQSDRSSLGARYAKGRDDNTDNNLRLNYFTKEDVYDLLDGVAKTYIVSEMPTTPYYLLSEDAVALAGKTYYGVSFTQDTDPISSEMMMLYEQKAFIPPWSTDPQIYYELADPTTWDPTTKNYYKVDAVTQKAYQEGEAITEVVYTEEPRYPEPNTYYLVGNDADGYKLYYWDSELQEAYVGSYDLDLSEYQKKFHENVSPLGNLSDNDKVTWLDFSSNTAWKVMLKDIKAYILDATYPVGSIYMTMDVTFKPADVFGGTWQRIEDRFLLAAGSTYNVVNSTGGNKETTILRSDLPNVSISTSSNGKKTINLDGVRDFIYKQGGYNNKWGIDYGHHEMYNTKSWGDSVETASNHSHSFNLNGNVTQTKLNNMPPYVTVMVWKRTA